MTARVADIPVAGLFDAARRPEVIEAIRAFYRQVDRRIAGLPGTCWNRGDCCRFGRFGHRLYVTALEVAYYLVAIQPASLTDDACPHAHDGRCHVRDHRPLGCRVFYCDPAARHWQGPLTEQLLARLRAMHEEFGVAYFYADWMVVLQAIGYGHVAASDHRRQTDHRPQGRSR